MKLLVIVSQACGLMRFPRELLPHLSNNSNDDDDDDDDSDNNKTDYNRIQRRSSRFFGGATSSLRRELSPAPQVARAQLCANHVQRIERLSRATCSVTCHVVRRDSSAVELDRV